MKLIYIANIRLPTEKAHGIQIMKMCEAFARQGHRVELVVPRRLNELKDDPFSYYGVGRIFGIRRLPVLDLVRFGSFGFWVETLSFSVAGLFYALFKKDSAIYTRDESAVFLLSFFGKNVFWETHTQSESAMTSRSVRVASGIITLTHASKKYYIRTFGVPESKILVSADGVDVEAFKLPETKNELRAEMNLPINGKIVGYVGKYKTMGEAKGVDEIVEAFSGFQAEIPEARLMIVGLNKDEMKELESVCDARGVGKDRRILLPHAAIVEIPRYLKICDVLVMNYPNTEHYAHFMSPLKLFEYMASGVPVVTTDLPSIREILDERTAVFVRPGDTKDLSRGLRWVLVNKNKALEIADAALAKVSLYSWNKRAEGILLFIG